MARGGRSLPREAKIALWLLRAIPLAFSGKILLVMLLMALLVAGSKAIAGGGAACQLPTALGGPGVQVFGDSALTGLADKLTGALPGREVRGDARQGRTAQNAVNDLHAMPDDAPGTFIVSVQRDDPAELDSYTKRLGEMSLLLSGRTVIWITAPGNDDLTRRVHEHNTGESGTWKIVDFAASVKDHPSWWDQNQATDAGLNALTSTLTSLLSPQAAPETGVQPAADTARIDVVSSTTGETFQLTGERRDNAQAILATGAKLGVPQPGLVIGIATALQESRLSNLDYGDRDSLGLFQQRPSQGWGSPEQIRDPAYAATQFFSRLLRVPGWQHMAPIDAAHAVQRSAFPEAVAQWLPSATRITAALQGLPAPGCGPSVNVPGSPGAQTAVNTALSQIGVPYVWGGGNTEGPTTGDCTDPVNDCSQAGFDCSGLLLYAWGKAGVRVPHHTPTMWTDPAFTRVTDKAQLQPGDMVMFAEKGVPMHAGMYIGNNQMVHAPRTGTNVRTESLDGAWNRKHYIGALRPKA